MFKDIDAFEFKRTDYNSTTASYSFYIKMTLSNGKHIEFNSAYSKSNNKISDYLIVDESIQKKRVLVIVSGCYILMEPRT